MKIHEYQAKELLARFGVPVPESVLVHKPEEAAEAYRKLMGSDDGGVVAVKAQIHAGGRGKGGGVKLAKSAEEAQKHASEILGMSLVTHQTGPEGQLVRKIIVEKGCQIDRELYVGLALDRAVGMPVLMASEEGGMEIEEVAAKSPEKILKEPVDPRFGLQGFQARRLALGLNIDKALLNKAATLMQRLAKAYVDCDCSIAEINPLVTTKDGQVLALDAKMNFDDNALYRHKDIVEYRDLDEEDPAEVQASKFDLSYIKLDGNIGCMVNGAGLAMATMDIIKLHGAEPANFLDVGGGATREKVTEAFKILLSDDKVQAVLVNIFGGIMRCDVIAQGIVEAVREIDMKVPLVVRLEGTNVDQGKKILAESGLALTAADDMDD
ncbi:MAG: ADP-forming succinate--CoA ligase subunit beta, partial [Planctomycetota bacterium]